MPETNKTELSSANQFFSDYTKSPNLTNTLLQNKNKKGNSATIPTTSSNSESLSSNLELVFPKTKTSSSSEHARLIKTSESSPTSLTTSVVVTLTNESDSIHSPISMTEAKREKHRNKKQSQRAAKRASGTLTNTSVNQDLSDVDGINSKSPNSDISDSRVAAAAALLSLSPSYAFSAGVDSDLNWNALIESQSNQLDQYLSLNKNVASISENNAWTVVTPSNSVRVNRNTNVSNSTRTETADWKTNNTTNAPYKRRLSIPVSRHDIGKVIGQGGAVVSALRNMSGIQIDIESARSDEVTERMVYLKGPNDAVQRTFETIQGLLSGSIAGNDVLLTYAAMKKSVTVPSSVSFGNSLLGALASKTVAGAVSSMAMSNLNRTTTLSVTKPAMSSRPARRTGKAQTGVGPARISLNQTIPSSVLNKPLGRMVSVSTISLTNTNNNNNITIANGGSNITNFALSPSTTNTILSNFSGNNKFSLSTNSWNSAALHSNNNNNCSSTTKGNFASVAAAGLVSHSTSKNCPEMLPSKTQSVVNNKLAVTSSLNIPNLPSTGPVSLLSLDLSGYPLNSQMFSDFVFPVSTNTDVIPDSLDETSFPPLNSSLNNLKASTPVFSTTTLPMSLTNHSEIVGKSDSISFSTVTFAPIGTTVDLINQTMTNCKSNTFNDLNHYDVIAPITSNQNSATLHVSYSQSQICSSVYSPILGSLTVSPPIGNVHPSQTHTPIGSGSSYSISLVTTPAIGKSGAFTQPKSFARAPGSERSAHQRNANVTSASTTTVVGLNDSYPSSAMSLDITDSIKVVENSLLLTPNKAVLSDSFGQDTLPQHHYRSEPSCDWQTTILSTSTLSSSVFSKNSAFSLPTSNPLVDQISVNSTSEVSHMRNMVDGLRPLASNWPLQSEVKAGFGGFCSGFQSPSGACLPGNQNSDPSSDSLILRNQFNNISNMDLAYNIPFCQTNHVFRQVPPHTPSKISGGLLLSSVQNELNLDNSVASSGNGACPITIQNVFNSPMRPSKAGGGVSTLYLEPRMSSSTAVVNMMNGVSNMAQQSISSVPLNNAQLSSMVYPLVSQQSVSIQQQQLQQIQRGALSNFNNQSSAGIGSRSMNNVIIGGTNNTGGLSQPPTSHSLMNHPAVHFQMNYPPPLSGPNESYTPPPYMSGFVQGGSVLTNPSSVHPNTGFASNLMNGEFVFIIVMFCKSLLMLLL